MSKNLKVSDIVTKKEIESWEENQIVTITAGTGKGKSFFIKNVLYDYAKAGNKKILMLLHRVNCVNQFKAEIERDNKSDTIDIMTYQKLEYIYKKKETFDFSDYEYIVCDEYHFFMSDASFNKYTDISLNSIIAQDDKVRIFMSATADYMKRYLKGKLKLNTRDYELPIEFNFIKELGFFNAEKSFDKLIKQSITENKKTLVFVQSATLAYQLFKKYKEYATFNCGKSDKHYKYVDEDEINEILTNEKFNSLLLISTSCMDAGVNLCDEDLKKIIVDIKDIGTLVQCIGRKRPQHENDKVNVYIRAISNQQLGGIETQIKKKVEMSDYLQEHSVKEYIEKYPRENDKYNIVYDDILDDNDKCTKKINELMRFKCLTDIVDISIIKSYGDFSYCKYLARKFGFYDDFDMKYDYRIVEEDVMKNTLEDYLNGITGQKLFKDEQNELIKKIDLKVNRKQQRSYRKLNDGLEMIELPFIIIPKKSGSVRYWIVEKVED